MREDYVCTSGPPGCEKSDLIGQIMREYIRRHPKREIFFFSQVGADRAIDSVVDDVADKYGWNPDLFTRVDLNKMMEADITIDDLRGEESERLGTRTGSLCIFDDIDKLSDKETQKKIDVLKDAIQATGRDHDILKSPLQLL